MSPGVIDEVTAEVVTYIWSGDDSSGSIDKTKVSTGNTVDSFSFSDSWGVGIDGQGSIWAVNDLEQSIYQLTTSGSIITGFSSPYINPKGLGLDSQNSIWNADESAGSIYQVDQTGSEIVSISTPGTSPRGLGLDSQNSLWNADSNDSLYKLDQTGSILVSFATPANRPTGVGLDGGGSENACIWNADLSGSAYRLNLSGLEDLTIYLSGQVRGVATTKDPATNPS